MWIFDIETLAFLAVNLAAIRHYGYSRDEFLAMSIADIRPPADRCALQLAVGASRTSASYAGTWVHLTRGGGQIVVDISTEDIVFRGRQARLVLAVDVTRFRKVEARIDDEARMLAQVNDAVLGLDVEWKVTYWNAAAERLFGIAVDDAVGHSLVELVQFSWLGRENEERALSMLAETGRWRGDNLVVTRYGRELHLESSVMAQVDENRRPIGSVAVMRDVTSQKSTENALRESERRFSAAFEQAAVGVALVSTNGRFLLVNQKLCDILGYLPIEMYVRHFADLTHPDDVEASRENARRMAMGEISTYETEKRYVRKDGTFVWVQLRSSVVGPAPGSAGYFMTVIEDISQRKKADAAILKAHAECDRLLSAISTILIGVDRHGGVIRWNDAAAQAFGVESRMVLAKPLRACAIHWDDERVDQTIAQAISGERSIDCDVPYFRPDGSGGMLSLVINPSRGDSGECKGFLLLAVDVTERRSLEKLLLKSQKMESIGQIAAGVAHEINTPVQFVGDNLVFLRDAFASLARVLTAYRGSLGMIGGNAASSMAELERESDMGFLLEEIPKAMSQSADGLDRIAAIVAAMKRFTHPETKATHAANINRELENTLVLATNEYKYTADVATEFAADLPPVVCVVGEINQVFLNLIVNAAQAIAGATPGGCRGTITISTRRDGDAVEIRVRDTGPGIAPANRGMIFRPFFTTKSPESGTGQGLHISRAIVDRHHGSLQFESEVGAGTTFIVRLPIAGL